MASLSFAWDPEKEAANREKHGVGFDEAASTFLDDRGRVIPDPDHSADEARWVLLGLSWRWRLLVVCFAHARGADVLRIISARPASRRERAQYRAG